MVLECKQKHLCLSRREKALLSPEEEGVMVLREEDFLGRKNIKTRRFGYCIRVTQCSR